jgi:hypothetical protein
MGDADLTPPALVLEPDEQRVADAVRGALGAPPAPPGLLDGVQHRAARRHRRRLAGGATAATLAVAGLAALLPLVALPPSPSAIGAPTPTSVEPPSGGPAPDSAPEALLTDEEVATVAPGASTQTTQTGPGGDQLGGLCGTTPLEGEPPTASARRSWGQEADPARGFTASVDEEVNRWPSAEGATAHAQVTATSPTQCGDVDGSPSDQATYLLLEAQQDGGPPRTLAAAAVEGSEDGWVVRATDVAADGVTAVDLTVTLEAESSAAAGSAVERLLDLALVRAVEEVAVPQPTSPPRPVDQDPLLTPDLVGFFIPNAVVVDEPAPVTDRQDPSGAPTGGLCGGAVLAGVPAPAAVWAGAWEQDGPGAGDRDTTALRETVLHWDDATPEAAAAYVEATRSSASGCADPQAPPEEQVSYRLLPELAQEGEVEVVAVSSVPDSATAWRVRAVGTGPRPDGARTTVVDLDLVVLAATAEDAAWISDGVLQISLTHATTDTSVLEWPGGSAP